MKYWEIRIALALFLSLALALALVRGDPAAPLSITTGASSRANFTQGGNNVNAMAGNITEIIMNGISITQTWQGYHGNVTGRLTLQNANNQTLYDWQTIGSTGEVYASNNSNVNWSSVQCVSFTANGSEYVNLSVLESMFGVGTTDVDGFNETFNQTYSGQFFIGSRKINGTDACPKTNLYNSTGAQTVWFSEVLMTDNSTRGVVFVSLTEENALGFDARTWDFEMIVADDGHSGDTAVTTYYFFTEMV